VPARKRSPGLGLVRLVERRAALGLYLHLQARPQPPAHVRRLRFLAHLDRERGDGHQPLVTQREQMARLARADFEQHRESAVRSLDVIDALEQAALHRMDRARRLRQLQQLARGLDSDHHGAAAASLEGLDEQLTVPRLKLQGALARVLRTTNAIENLMGSVQRYTRNVKRWRGAKMIVRWAAAAVLRAQRSFRAVHGYRDIPKLTRALQAVDFEKIAA